MRKVYALGVVLFLVGVAIVAYAFAAPAVSEMLVQTESITDEAVINEHVLVFVRDPYMDDYGLTRLPGYVDNKSGRSISSVQLEFQLTDGDGNKKELVTYEVENVSASSRRSFDANAGTIGGDRDATVTVKSIEVVN